MRAALLVLIAATSLGCSYRGAYEGIQTGNRFQCSKLPPSQYEECMERASKTYDEYEQERQEVLKQ